MSRSNRLSLSIAGTAAVALASLPLGITPASAAKVSEGATSSIGVVEAASNAQQFNVKTQGASTGLVAQIVIGGGGRVPRVRAFLEKLLEFLGVITPSTVLSPGNRVP